MTTSRSKPDPAWALVERLAAVYTVDTDQAALIRLVREAQTLLVDYPGRGARRYCEPCEQWMTAKVCKACGADTVKAA